MYYYLVDVHLGMDVLSLTLLNKFSFNKYKVGNHLDSSAVPVSEINYSVAT